MANTVQDFKDALALKFQEAEAQGKHSLQVNSFSFHKSVSSSSSYILATCSRVLHNELRIGDEIVSNSPRKGITYVFRLPR